MCGICGIANYQTEPARAEHQVTAMNNTLVHRGPDQDGALVRPYAAMAMRRLSIIDLQGGRQPISNETGDIHIVYNGEVYNFRQLRDDLEAKGHVFRTRTDTESLLHAYEEYGPDFIEKLNGMFAFCILDEPRGSVLLARDRIGIKPLYYCYHSGVLYFGSEIKALLAHPDVPREMDTESLTHYLAHGYIPGEHTIFRRIRKLLPGYRLEFRDGRCVPEPYWQLPWQQTGPTGDKQAREHLLELLEDAVRIRLISDVPLGAFLSGGIDSSAVAALMSRAAGRISTFSIGFQEQGFDERAFARKIAEKFDTNHHEYVVDYPSLPDFLPKMVRAFDQPFADSSAIPTFLLSQNARQKVTVALSGNGGDELFGGYTKYLAEKLCRRLALVPAPLRAAALKILDGILGESPDLADRNRRIKRMLRYSLAPGSWRPVSWTTGFDADALTRLLRSDFLNQGLSGRDVFLPWLNQYRKPKSLDAVARQMFTDIKIYLPDNNLLKDDIMGMANSLEIRVPFLDHRLVEFAVSLPTDLKIRDTELKHVLKQAVGDLLPPEIIHRPKQGFTVPVGHWLNHKLRAYADDVLDPADPVMAEYFNRRTVRRLLREHRSGKADHGMRLWMLIIFRLWHQEFL